MGERKGTNHYYPPDYDPRKGGLNKFLGTHALRERARKLHLGILIIRFEMPYNIWCLGCNNHIGMGVRYNAEKKKIGMYYSTPIYQFRMKCHLCDNHFEIKTDPANLDYVIVSGASRQENRWDPKQNEQVVPEDKETSKRLFDDAMFKLEHGEGDKKTALHVKPTLARLAAKRDEFWQDDYAANCILRARFRAKKQEQQAKHAKDQELLAKSSLSLSLLPESEDDANLAAKLSLKCASAAERRLLTVEEIISSPVLPGCSGTATSIHSEKTARQLAALEKDRAVLGGIVRRPLPVVTASTGTIAMLDGISATENNTTVSHRKDLKGDDTGEKHENKSLSLISDYYDFSSSDEGSNMS